MQCTPVWLYEEGVVVCAENGLVVDRVYDYRGRSVKLAGSKRFLAVESRVRVDKSRVLLERLEREGLKEKVVEYERLLAAVAPHHLARSRRGRLALAYMVYAYFNGGFNPRLLEGVVGESTVKTLQRLAVKLARRLEEKGVCRALSTL